MTSIFYCAGCNFNQSKNWEFMLFTMVTVLQTLTFPTKWYVSLQNIKCREKKITNRSVTLLTS